MRTKIIIILAVILVVPFVLASCSGLLNRNAPGTLGGSVLLGQETQAATLQALSTSAELAKATAFAEFDNAQETLQGIQTPVEAAIESAMPKGAAATDTETSLPTSTFTASSSIAIDATATPTQKSIATETPQASPQPESTTIAQPPSETPVVTAEANPTITPTLETKQAVMASATSTSTIEEITSTPFDVVTATLVGTTTPLQSSPTACACAPLIEGDEIHQEVAFLLDALPENLQFLTLELVEWPDSCLGLPQPGEFCAQMITPGYKGTVQLDGQVYTFHSDLNGKQVRLEETSDSSKASPATSNPTATPTPQSTAAPTAQNSPTSTATAVPTAAPSSAAKTEETKLPGAILEQIAHSLNVPASHLTASDVKEQTWSDGCIDFITSPSTTCAADPIRGYAGTIKASRVIFGGDPLYLFRSDSKGERISLFPVAAQKTVEMLAAKQGIETDQVTVVEVSPMEWPNTCAYLPTPVPANIFCVQVPLPGWQVSVKAGGDSYQYHTNLNGEFILPENP